jgi:hypothetical protein
VLRQKIDRRGLIVMTHWFDIPVDDGRLSSVKIIEASRCLKYLDSIEDMCYTSTIRIRTRGARGASGHLSR